MPFEPRNQEATEPAIVDKIMIVTERDMKPALDFFDVQAHGSVQDNLPAFAIMTDGEPSAFKYPLLVLGVQRVTSKESTQIDEGNLLDQVITVGAAVVVHSTASLKAVRATARKYIRAFKSVIRSASASDLFPGTALALNHSIDIDHRYLKHATNETGFVQAIEIEIKLTFGES